MPLDQEKLLQRASEMEPLPPTAAKLAEVLGRGNYEITEVVGLIQYDPALTIRFLKVANSAIYRGEHEVGTVDQAILRLGATESVSLLLVFGVQKNLEKPVAAFGLAQGELWHHSVASAVVAQKLAGFTSAFIPPEAFTAALIHDIGKLLLGEFLSVEDLDLLQKAWQLGDLPPVEAETQILGVHHGELGGIIAQNWNFPESIVKAVIYHHHPESFPSPLTDAVYLANEISKFVPEPEATLPADLPLDEEVLMRLQLTREILPEILTASKLAYQELIAAYGK